MCSSDLTCTACTCTLTFTHCTCTLHFTHQASISHIHVYKCLRVQHRAATMPQYLLLLTALPLTVGLCWWLNRWLLEGATLEEQIYMYMYIQRTCTNVHTCTCIHGKTYMELCSHRSITVLCLLRPSAEVSSFGLSTLQMKMQVHAYVYKYMYMHVHVQCMTALTIDHWAWAMAADATLRVPPFPLPARLFCRA